MKSFIKHILTGSLILGFLFLSFISYGQERFNVRYDSGFPNTLFKSVIEIDGGYFTTGFLGDTLGFNNGRPTIYARFDYNGSLLFQKTIGGEEPFHLRRIGSQNPDLQFLNDSTLIHSGVTYDAEGVRQGFIMKVSQEGDTLAMNRFHSPNYPGEDIGSIYNSMTTLRCQIATDGNILVSSSFANDPVTQHDIIIQKYTPEGALLWTYEHISDQPSEYVTALIPTEDGGGIFEVYDIVEEGVSGRSHFFRCDNQGNLLWEYFTDVAENFGAVPCALLEEEFLICSVHQKDLVYPHHWASQLMKMDTTGVVHWRTSVWENDFNHRHYSSKVVKSEDGNYVLSGVYNVGLPNTNDDSSSAFLAKINTEGERIWRRKYKYIDTGDDIHKLNDLKATSDGGYVFCGESNIINNDTLDLPGPQQQGWIVKVDEYGCLVEGCEIYDYVEEIGDIHTEEYIKIGPIPAQDVLNIYQIKKLPPDAFIEIIDMNGKQVKSFHIETQGTTLMVDISFLPAGQYLINLIDRGLVLQSERVLFY